MNIYREIIMDHYKSPRNFGALKEYDLTSHEYNPLCGDELTIYIKLDNNKIENIKFNGSGCAISIAASSILTEHLIGKDLKEINSLKRENIMDMLGTELSVSRVKCAMLALVAMKNSLRMKENGITN